jgi:PTS system cellobiose-specific IIC component
MNKISEFLEEKLNPAFGKFASLTYVRSLNRAFMTLLPLIILGAVTSLLSGLNVTAYQTFIANTGIYDALITINNLSLGLYALWVAGSLGYFYSFNLGLKQHSMILAFVSMFCFFLVTPYVTVDSVKSLQMTYLGSQGLFSAMIITPIVVRVYKLCIDKNIRLKMPEGVPAYISDSFSGLIPALLVSIICVALQKLVVAIGYQNVSAFVYAMLAKPLNALTTNPFTIVLLLWIPSLFWFFGIHGGAATQAILPPLLLPLAMENAAAYAAGEPLPNMFAMGIMNLTGCSTVIWAVLCLKSKEKRFNELGKLALVPSLFGVTEPFNFGLPLVLNPYLMIPQLLIPIVNVVLLIVLMSVGIMPYAHSLYVWGVPVFFSGFMQAGVAGILFQVVVIVLDYFVALPFFKAYEKSVHTEE